MSVSKLCLVAPLLLAACGPTPPERARLSALSRLRHELPPAAQPVPESLAVYNFPQDTVSYFSSEVPTFGDGYLVTYETRPAGPGAALRRHALFVAGNDSAFYFLPVRHAAEFERRYHVPVPPPLP